MEAPRISLAIAIGGLAAALPLVTQSFELILIVAGAIFSLILLILGVAAYLSLRSDVDTYYKKVQRLPQSWIAADEAWDDVVAGHQQSENSLP
jgi:hypothetical protein